MGSATGGSYGVISLRCGRLIRLFLWCVWCVRCIKKNNLRRVARRDGAVLFFHRQRQKYVNNKCLPTRLRWVISLLPTRCFSVDGMQQKIRWAASEWSGDAWKTYQRAFSKQTINVMEKNTKERWAVDDAVDRGVEGTGSVFILSKDLWDDHTQQTREE